MAREHVAIKSSSKTNCTESVTNRFQQNEKRGHWPRGSTRQKLTHKFFSLTFYSNKSNCNQQSNTHSQSKSCLPSNSRAKRYQSKRVASLNDKEQNRKPYNRCFSLIFRKNPPSCWQTVCQNTTICISRTCSKQTPLQVNTFLCLSIPKTTYRFTKTRKSTISSLSSRMICRMISNQYQQN